MRIIGLSVTLLIVTGCTVTSPEPNLAGQDVSLTVMHSSDMHSRFLPYFFAPGQIDKGLGLAPRPGQSLAVVGGIARIATVLKCIRGMRSDQVCRDLEPLTGPPSIRSMHVDSGDIFQGAPIFNIFNGEVEVRTMTEVGLTAMVVGNHEFDKGAPNLVTQLQRFAGFPMLAANYQFGDPNDPTQPKLARVIPPYLVTNVGGLRIGLIGMANLSSIQGILEGGNSLGIRPISDEQAVADAARVLRPMVDVLAVVSHLGLEEDEDVAASDAAERDENTAIAINGIDVIFGGHLHIVLNPPKNLPHFDSNNGGALTGQTLICHSGAFAKYIGRLDLVIHVPTAEEAAAGSRPQIKAHTYRLIPIDDHIPDDPETLNVIEPYMLQMGRYLNLEQVYAVVPCPKDAAQCPKVQRNDTGGGDSQLGNLVATSMRLRQRVEADFALTNSLGIRTDFESGALNLEQLYNVFPFENTITTMFLSGDEVQQMLDFVASRSSERGCRTQAQVSGIYFDLVCSRDDEECNARQTAENRPLGACAKNIVLGEKCRLPDGTLDPVKCRPLDRFSQYRVAVNDYIAQGGSGFSVLKRNTTKFNTGISLRDSLIDFIRNQPLRCAPQDFSNITGVTCRDTHGEPYDCTRDCCCRDPLSNACTPTCAAWDACKTAIPARSPQPYDLSNAACITDTFETHDGRINPIAGTGL